MVIDRLMCFAIRILATSFHFTKTVLEVLNHEGRGTFISLIPHHFGNNRDTVIVQI